jgi:transposase
MNSISTTAFRPNVRLKEEERIRLNAMVRRGRWSERERRRARLLLGADADQEIALASLARKYSCHYVTAKLTCLRYKEKGLDAALSEQPRSGQPRKLAPDEEALVVATACSQAPRGHDHWTIALLTKKISRKKGEHVGLETVRKVLLRNELKPWREKNVVYPQSHTGV